MVCDSKDLPTILFLNTTQPALDEFSPSCYYISNAFWIELHFARCVLLPNNETVPDYDWDTGNPSKFLW